MLDIGTIHRREYELSTSRMERPSKEKHAKEEVAAKSAGVEMDTVVIAQAPGRIHFMGEHGEPHAGLYLSAAIDRWIQVAVSPRKDTSLRFYAPDLGERKRTTMASLKYKREDRWANYVKVAIQLFAELGSPVRGLNFTVMGNIPQHVGLASSSAMEVAAAAALRGLLKARIGDTDMARKLAAVHSVYFEKDPGAVDYMVGLSARSDQFLVVDESTLGITKIKSPFSRCRIIITDSRVPRTGVETELQIRRENLGAALEVLAQGRKGASLRDFAAMDLMDSMGNLPEKIRRRSLHVVQEIQRVSDAAEMLRRADMAGFAKLVFHSHEGLRDLYEISCPEIDWMVKRAQETSGVYGARMVGHGFGGCTYAIVKNEAVDEYRQRLDDYERIFGFNPTIHEVKIATGCRLLP